MVTTLPAFKTEATLSADGILRLDTLPFSPGETVDVIVLARRTALRESKYPLRGLPVKLIGATDPVDSEAWSATNDNP